MGVAWRECRVSRDVSVAWRVVGAWAWALGLDLARRRVNHFSADDRGSHDSDDLGSYSRYQHISSRYYFEHPSVSFCPWPCTHIHAPLLTSAHVPLYPTVTELEFYGQCKSLCARFNNCGVSNHNADLAAMFRHAADKQCGGDCSRFPCPTPLIGVDKGDVGWAVIQKNGPGSGTAGSDEL